MEPESFIQRINKTNEKLELLFLRLLQLRPEAARIYELLDLARPTLLHDDRVIRARGPLQVI